MDVGSKLSYVLLVTVENQARNTVELRGRSEKKMSNYFITFSPKKFTSNCRLPVFRIAARLKKLVIHPILLCWILKDLLVINITYMLVIKAINRIILQWSTLIKLVVENCTHKKYLEEIWSLTSFRPRYFFISEYI
jgi:hypothetical protein